MIKFMIECDKKKRVNYIASFGYVAMLLDPDEREKLKDGFEDHCGYFKDFDVDERDLPVLNDAQIVDFSIINNKAFIMTKNDENEITEYSSDLNDFSLFIDMEDLIRYVVLYCPIHKSEKDEYYNIFKDYCSKRHKK